MLPFPVRLLVSVLTPTATFLSPPLFWASALKPLAVLLLPLLAASALAPVAVLKEPVVLTTSAAAPVAVLPKPELLLTSACQPTPVLLLPVVSSWSAPNPNAVFSAPPAPILSTLASACVPPAVLAVASVTVGLQPGATQTGWPQPGVMVNSMIRLPTRVRQIMRVIATSMRRT